MRELPKGFIESLPGVCEGVADALTSTEPSVSVRINRAKGAAEPAGAERVPWCADGFFLDERPQFTFDPAMHQGLYYVQDSSSMAITAAVEKALSLNPWSDVRYLDACAAPGGKTTAAMSVLPPEAFVVANEFDPRRASILAENIAKWGAAALVTRMDASAIRGLDGFFDIVAADVPCSGEGMMRKDPQAVAQWSPRLVADCAALQRRIVDALWPVIRPGGYLIYSTCTFNVEENEKAVQYLIDTYGAVPVEIPSLAAAEEVLPAADPYRFPAYRFIPGRVRGEGQFICLLWKPGSDFHASVKPSKIKNYNMATPVLAGDWTYRIDKDGEVTAIPAAHASLYDAVARQMHVVYAGIRVGTVKGKDFIPGQPLAMAQALKRGVYPEFEVDRATALAYLRRDSLTLDGAPRGFVLLTHAGHPLGFVKSLGSRANNLYPQQWRILKR